MENKEVEFKKELTSLINRYSRENISDTPDFILAEYLMKCLENFEVMVDTHAVWYSGSQRFKEKSIKTENYLDDAEGSDRW